MRATFPIVMYHGVSSATLPYRYGSASELEWVIDVEGFRRQLRIVRDEGYRVVLLRDLPALFAQSPSPARIAVLTFDDGHETCRLNALAALEEFGFPAEFFTTAGWTDSPNYMTRAQLREMHARGMSIQSHGFSHRFLTELADDDLRGELADSRALLAEVVAHPVEYIAFPGGRFDARVERFVEQSGYRGSCTSDRGSNAWGTSLYSMKRVGVTKDTTDREFRAMLTDDRGFFVVQRARYALIAAVRRVIGPKAFGRLRRARHGRS